MHNELGQALDHNEVGEVAEACARVSARAAEPRRLVEGRAAHERDHGRRGPAAAAVPRHPADGRARAGRTLDPLPATDRRYVGQLRGRSGRPVHHGRGVRRAAPGRRRPDDGHLREAREWIREHGGGIEASRVFTRIWLALFGEWSWDELPTMPPETRAAAAVGAAERLRLGLLGPPDRRARSPSSRRCARCVRCRSRWPSCAPGHRRRERAEPDAQRGPRFSASSTAC